MPSSAASASSCSAPGAVPATRAINPFTAAATGSTYCSDDSAFTVRKVSFGVGVERTFPINSPIFDQIEVVTRGDVRRAKLYYLRNLRGKKAKIKERREA